MESGGGLCKLCSGDLDTEDFFWRCKACAALFCENCFFDAGHPEHKDQTERCKSKLPDRPLFFYEDPITQNRLYLGNFVAATPGSETLRQHDIRFVLTLIDFADDGDSLDEMERLRQVYEGGKTNAEERSIRYHLIPMPDVLSPERLPSSVRSVLEEATCFIDAGLQQGSVLVHCHRGEKRSPTIFLAWMLTRDVKVMDAIELIDASYTGKEGWGSTYKRTRQDWIEELKKWSRTWKERQLLWSQSVTVLRE